MKIEIPASVVSKIHDNATAAWYKSQMKKAFEAMTTSNEYDTCHTVPVRTKTGDTVTVSLDNVIQGVHTRFIENYITTYTEDFLIRLAAAG